MARRQRGGAIPDTMNVLLVGSGGREHALAWRLKRSGSVRSLYATGTANPGIKALARDVGFAYSDSEQYRLEQFCRAAEIDLVVIGPEGPLAAGLADTLESAGVAVFGPTRDGARLESDKAYAKQLMRSASVPTAEGRVFDHPDEAKEYLRSRESAVVVKASGLAGGKGVAVPETLDEALLAVDTIMVERAFGEAGDRVVIEERMTGPEVSLFSLIDGRSILSLAPCQDHKRLLDGDSGPNTGGMGAYCPTPVIDAQTAARVEREIVVPTVDALRRDGVQFRGVLYTGLMLTHAGPKVLEFNVRFGDPECQCLVRTISGDFAKLLFGVASGSLEEASEAVNVAPGAACCVVLAGGEYPAASSHGEPITGIDDAERVTGVTVFHAGTSRVGGQLVTDGGRVLNVVAHAETIDDARARAYDAADLIHFDGKSLRRDIAHQAVTDS